MTYNSSLYISLKLHEDRELATLGVGGGGFENLGGGKAVSSRQVEPWQAGHHHHLYLNTVSHS